MINLIYISIFFLSGIILYLIKNDLKKFKPKLYYEIDNEILVYLLRTNKWNIQKVAESLKQTTRNIYRKVKLYNISKD